MFAEGFWPTPVGQRDRDGCDGVRHDGLEHGHRLAAPTHRARAHLFGRVNSVYRWLVWGSISIGAALGGVVASEFGCGRPSSSARDSAWSRC